MIPPGKTTLHRMQDAAHNEAQRIEIIEDGWISAGRIAMPRPDRVKLRDDFAGIVRLIDVVLADDIVRGRIEDALKRQAAAVAAQESPSVAPDASLDLETADQ